VAATFVLRSGLEYEFRLLSHFRPLNSFEVLLHVRFHGVLVLLGSGFLLIGAPIIGFAALDFSLVIRRVTSFFFTVSITVLLCPVIWYGMHSVPRLGRPLEGKTS
jgi:hypothetical protein